MSYRALFRAHLDGAAIDDIRLALNQSQPLGNARFYAKIESMTGMRQPLQLQRLLRQLYWCYCS